MKQPSLEYLQSNVKAGELSITTQLMDHPSLPNFLSFLKQTEITLKNVSFASENEGEVNVTAKNAFALIPLHEVTLTFYKSKVNASDYDFFFQGTITKSSLSELIKSGFISELTQSLLPDLNNIEFNDIVLFFTSFDNSFILEIIDSKSILVIPKINLQLKKIGFSYEKCLTDETIENFLVHSVLDFGSNKISTNITVPISPESGLKVWSLTLLEAVILNNGLKDVLSFFESYEEFNSIVIKNLVSLLPPDIAVINDFALTELVMHIDAGKKKVQLFNFSIQSLQEFKLLEGFVLKNIGVSVFTTLFDGATNCKLDIFGGFSFVESIFVDINIRLPITGIGDWVIKLEGNADIEKIENLEKLPFIKIKELNLPPELLVLNGISLERLVVILNPKEAKVKSLEFAVQLQAESKLLPGIKVKNPYMEFKFTFLRKLIMKIEASIGAEMEFAGLPQLWLESGYNNGWTFSGGTRQGQELSLKKVWEELIPGTPLPVDFDLRLSNILLEIELGNANDNGKRDYSLKLSGSITFELNPSDDFESQLKFEKIYLHYKKTATDETQTTVDFSLKGNANINDEIIVTDFSFDYNYSYNSEKKSSEWKLDGSLYLLAFQRLMAFKAQASVLENSQKIGFNFESTQPILHAAYFNKIKDANPNEILTALNGGKPPANNQLLIAQLAPNYPEKLGNDYTPEQKNEIAQIVESARRANEDLVTIPDILNENKTLCSVSPRKFLLELSRENGKFKSLDFAIGADLTVYNTWNNQSEIISIKNGIVSTGFDLATKSFYLKFETEKTEIKPLSAIAMVPDLMPKLINAFGETSENHPKTSAFVNLIEIHPLGFTFVKQEKNWQINGSLRLVLNNGLSTLDENLYNFLESIFPKTGNQRFIGGQLGYDSAEGLVFVLENNNGFEVPNFLATAASFINPQFKADFKERVSIDLDQALDLETSFIILDRVRLKIAKEIKLDMRLGIGLPSNLNDRLFNPASKIHGLINTYNREKFINANVKPTGPVKYETPLPNDGLLRASLSIGTDGISGQLDRFNIFNLEKIAEEFKDFLIEDATGVTLDFNALTNKTDKQYAKIKLDKIVFAIDLKKCVFTIKFGAQLLSNELNLPVRPLLKKLIGILPPDKFNVNALNTTADLFGDSITLKSLSFYDSASGNLNINGLLDFLKQFLLETHRNKDVFPKELTDLINTHLAEASILLPTMLLEYLAIKLPAGFNFNLEVTADQSISFSVEVPEPSSEQKAAGYVGYLQTLFPNPPMHINGIRLKKLGFGSALFNNAFRLDLSAELMIMGLNDLIPGIGFALARNLNATDERLQFIMPDNKQFGSITKIENLLMFIFPQTQIPIPVPVFYDRFSIYSAAISGAVTEMQIGFPRPAINITEVLKALGDLVNFFKNKEFSLPVGNYGTVRQNIPGGNDSVFPAFNTGPFYFSLPGIIGYEKNETGFRKKIQIGFQDIISLNSKELSALGLNTAKFGILSLAEKKYHRIKIDETRSEYPANYLIKFLPESQRIGSKQFVLFEIFEANYVWALSTPAEFKNTVWPLIKQEQARSSISGPGDTWVANELLTIIPGSDTWQEDQDGAVIVLKGGIKLSESLIIDAVTATSFTSGSGLATGLALRAKLAGIFDMELAGGIQINPGNADKIFGLTGKTHLKILNLVTVFKGNFSLYAGTKSEFRFNGILDLFPNELFGGERSPIQFYSGKSLGQKSDISGIINATGINIGHFNPDESISAAGVFLEIGKFYLAGTTRIVSTANYQDWEIKLIYCNTELILAATVSKADSGTEMQFGLSLNKPIGIEGFITLSGSGGNGGANGKLKIFNPGGNKFPVLQEFYLGGRITFLGLYTDLMIQLSEDEWQFALSNGVSIPGLLESTFNLNCRMASNYGWLKANSDFNVKLSLTIPKISFWFWLFGWHEVVIFAGTTWEGGFNTKLSINVYNPKTFDQVMNYDQELGIINAEIEKLTAEQEQKVKELESKINGYNKKKQLLKTQLEIKIELEKEIESLRQGLMSLRILDDLMTAREKKGSDDNWKNAYDSAWNTYFTLANEYTSRLDKIGFSTSDEKKVFLNRLEYLDKIFDYIVANGNKKYGYTKEIIKKVIADESAPDYDVILQFVLEAALYKKNYLAKHNISNTSNNETDTEILSLQEKISDLYILDQLFWARNSKGSDPEWENALKYASEKLFGAITNYRQRLESEGWKNEEQKQLYKVRVSYLNKIKENVIARGYRSNGYNQTYVDDAVIRGIMPDYDIILPVLFEVEKIKNNMLEKAGIDNLYEANDLPTQKLPDGFGLNDYAYEKNLAYNRLLTKDGLYDYLKDEILTNEITLRKLREKQAAIQNQKNSYTNRQPGEFRFELFLESQLVINGRVLYLPKTSLLVAPASLQDVIGNIGSTVLSTVTGNIWNLVLDAFKGGNSQAEAMSDSMSEGMIAPMDSSSQVNDSDFIWHKQSETYSAMALEDSSEPLTSNDKPPGYDKDFDLSKYVQSE